MPRPVLLFTGPWADLPLADLARRAAEWGYTGLELATWGDHFVVPRASDDADYASSQLALAASSDLQLPVLAAHRVGQAVCDAIIDERHQSLLPEYVWGDGDPEGVRERALAELVATVRAAPKLGAGLVTGFTGSPLWSYVAGYPQPSSAVVERGYAEFARRWHPVLDACQESGVRFALEVHPGQIAFDLYSAERTLEALDGREEFGFALDPAHFLWQGVDPVQFVRRFPDRIWHVHMKDATLSLDGRSSVLNSLLPMDDPRCGWQFRSPGRGGVDWDAFVRALNAIHYDGALAVDYRDPGMDRLYGVEDACRFVKSLDFPAPPPPDAAFG